MSEIMESIATQEQTTPNVKAGIVTRTGKVLSKLAALKRSMFSIVCNLTYINTHSLNSEFTPEQQASYEAAIVACDNFRNAVMPKIPRPTAEEKALLKAQKKAEKDAQRAIAREAKKEAKRLAKLEAKEQATDGNIPSEVPQEIPQEVGV